MNPTEVEDTKTKWQEYTEEEEEKKKKKKKKPEQKFKKKKTNTQKNYTKKILMIQITRVV